MVLLSGSLGCSSVDSIVVDRDVLIVGRVRDGQGVWLLTSAHQLVHVRVPDYTVQVSDIDGLRPTDDVWGLARTGPDELIVLIGMSTIGQLDDSGAMRGRTTVANRFLGLYGSGNGVLAQSATAAPGQPILLRLSRDRTVFGQAGRLRAARFSTRAETLAKNLVACGSGVGSEVPCWFNQSLRVDRIGRDGNGGLVDLVDLDEHLATLRSSTPIAERGPIIDAFIGRDHELWVLLRRGGKVSRQSDLVARYTSDGQLDGLRPLDGRARLILDAGGDVCRLLTHNGRIQEVHVG
jgi:hypothetical protein